MADLAGIKAKVDALTRKAAEQQGNLAAYEKRNESLGVKNQTSGSSSGSSGKKTTQTSTGNAGADAITKAMEQRAASLEARAQELNRLQEDLNQRYAALQSGQSTETAQQLAVEQDRLNDRKVNYERDSAQYGMDSAYYDTILAASPYIAVERAAEENGTQLSDGTQDIINTMQQRVNQIDQRRQELADQQAALAERARLMQYSGLTGDALAAEQLAINEAVAGLTQQQQQLMKDAGIYSEEARTYDDELIDRAEQDMMDFAERQMDAYYDEAAMQEAYEGQRAALYAEWQALFVQERSTGIYGNRTAADVQAELSALDSDYQKRMMEAESYWAERHLSELSDSERKLVEDYVEANRTKGTSESGKYVGVEEVEKLWNEMLNTFGTQKARELTQLGERAYDAEMQAERNERLKAYAQKGVGQAIVASAASVITNFAAAPGAVVEIVRQKINNPAGLQTLNVNAQGFEAQNATRSLRGGVTESIMPDEKTATAGQKAGAMLYSTAMSGIDSLVASLLPGKAGGVLLGATAATNTAHDITERGGTVNQALVGGVAAGAFEMIFESISIGQLKAMEETKNVRNVKTYLLNVAKSVGTNASEEAATELANILFDMVAMGDVSDYQMQLQELMRDNPNMTEQEAKRELAGALAMRVVESGISGALMGGVFGVFGNAVAANNTKKKDQVYNTLLLDGLIDQGLTYQGTTAFQLAADLQVRRNEGEVIPNEEVTELFDQVQQEVNTRAETGAGIAETTNAEAVEQMLGLPEQVQEIEEKLKEQQTVKKPEALPMETTAGEGTNVLTNEMQTERETVQTAPKKTVEEAPMREAADTEQRETMLGNDVARGVTENTAQGNTEENALRREAETEIRRLAQMYQGEELRQAAQNLANDMRMAGETAYAEEIEAAAVEMLPKTARTMGAVSANNVTAPAAGSAVQTEGVEYGGEAAGVSVRDWSERNDGQSAGGQTGRVASEAGRTAETAAERNVSAEQSRDAKAARRMLRGSGQSTRAATGLKNASTSGTPVYVLEEQDMDAEAYEIVNDGEANGYRVKLVYGAMTFNVRSGKKVRADGARSGDGLYIRMDAKDFTGRQLANHEMFHAMAEEDPGLIPEIMDQVISSLSEGEFERLMQAYEDFYGGVYDDYSRIVEELCADVYAGMDRANLEQAERTYADVTEKTEAVRGIAERRTGLRAIGERGVRETRAGPEGAKNAPADAEAERYSLVSVGGKYYTPTDEELIETHDTIEVVRVDGARYEAGVKLSQDEYKKYRDQQSEKMREDFGVYTNKDTAYSNTYGIINAEIGTKTLRKARSNGGVALLDILPKLHEIFENAVVIGTKADRANDSHIKGVVDLLGASDLGKGRIAVVKLNVKEYTDDTAKVYGNRVVEIEKLTVLAGESGNKTDSTSYAVSFEPILQRFRGAVNTESFSIASGQSREQVEERVAELEGLMENLMTEKEMMDPAEFNVRWFNLQMEKAALESELYDLQQTEERQRLREEAKARREKAEELNPQIEARRKKAREYDREARAAERRYEESKDAKELEEAKRLRERAKNERKLANDIQKELGGSVDVKNAKKVYRPKEAMKRTEDRLLNLFKIQAGNRGEARQALTGVLLETLERGYVGQETVEAVLRQMYRTGIDVVPADELYKDIAATLKNRKIYVSNELKSKYGDDWGKVRRQLLGLGIYTTGDRAEMGVDSVYADLAGQYPGVFDEKNVDMRGMLDEMLEYAGMGRAQHMTLAESALAQGLDSEEDFQNLYRLASEELARFADAAGVESRVLSKKEFQIAKIREEEVQKRKDMVEKRKRVEQMDKLRRQITRLGRKFEQNDALTKVAMSNLDKDAQSQIRNAMETVDTIANGFRKSTQKDLLALQESVGLAKEQPGFEENALQIIKAELLRKAEYLSMEDAMVDQKAKERLQNAMNAMDRLGKVRLTDMSVEDLEAMYTAVQAIIHEIDSVDKMIGEEWDRTVTETANQIREEVGRAKGISEKLRGEKISGARHLMAEQSLSPSRMLARLVGYDRSGAMGKVIREFEQGDLAAMKYALDADLKFGAFMKDKKTREWLKTATGKNAKMVTIEIPKVLEYGKGDVPIYDPKEKVSFQVSQMMLVQMSLDLQNEANTRHAEKGGYTVPKIKEYRKGNFDEMYNGAITVKIPRERLAQIVKEHLSAEGQEYARLLHSYYNGIGKTAINEVSQKLNGVDVARVKNYYPIHTNGDYRGREYNVFDATLEGIGSLKERQFSKTPILLEDASETFRYHRDQMARYVGYAVARRNFVALLNHRAAGGVTLRAEIEKKWSATAGESIDEFFRIIETGQLEENKDILRNLQGKYASAVLSYNVGSMMKQLGALPMAGSTVGHGAILRGMLHPTKMGRKQREFIRLYTPYLDYRGKGYTYREMAEVAGKNVHSESLDKTFDYLLGKNWLEAMDIKVNTALWHAAEYAVRRDTQLRPGSQADIEAGIDPYYKAVADVFNRMTHDTQTNYNLMARPPVLMKQGLVLRAFTMFRTDAYQVAGALRENLGAWQQARRNYRDAENDEAKTAAREQIRKTAKGVARTVTAVMGNAMIAVLVDELRQLIRGNDDDFFGEDGEILWEEIGKRVGKEVLMNVAGVFIFVEELAEYIEAKITGDRYYEPEVGRVGMLVDAADSLSKLGKTMGDVFHQANQIRKDGGDVAGYLDHEWDAVFGAIHSAAQDCSFLLGVPLKNFERTITTALGWILPEAKIAYNDMFTDYSKALLRDMSERELPYGIDAYLRDNCSITDEAVRDEYLRLYMAVGDSMMPGAEPPKTIKVGEGEDMVERELTLTDTGRWDSKYRETMIDETKALIESGAYKNLTDKEKAKALVLIDQYAEQVADQMIGAEADAWVRRTMEARVDPADVAVYKAATGGMKSAESYVWIAESELTEEEAVAVLGVQMQNAEGHTAAYTEMQKALENGLELTEWAEIYAVDDSKVKSFNQWAADGLDKDVALKIVEVTDGLEPEEGKSSVGDMQKYRAIAEGLAEEDAWAAIRTLMDNDNGREDLDAVKKTGITPIEYLDIREGNQISNYLGAVGLGIKTSDAVNIVKSVADIPKHADGSDITEKERQLAAVRASNSVETQILAYAVYGDKDDEQSSIEKLTKAWEACKLTPEDYTMYRINTGDLNAKDENGNSVTNLKKARVVMAINQMDLTKEQKNYLYDMNYKKDREKALWNINRSFTSAEEYANWL